MGAWGPGSFDNDDAQDWLGELDGAEDTSVVCQALAAITDLEVGEYIDAPDAAIAIAAAEVVAAGIGSGIEPLPEVVATWLDDLQPEFDDPDARLAARAVERIRKDSELAELWDSSGDGSAWQTCIDDLLDRLR